MTEVNQLLSELRYQLAPGIHTYSMCECGRKPCRGYGPCELCVTDELVKMGADPTIVHLLVNTIRTTNSCEAVVREDIENE